MEDELHEELDVCEPQWFDDRTGQPLDPGNFFRKGIGNCSMMYFGSCSCLWRSVSLYVCLRRDTLYVVDWDVFPGLCVGKEGLC